MTRTTSVEKKLNGRNYLEKASVDGRIILKWIRCTWVMIVNIMMNLLVIKYAEYFLTMWVTVSFSKTLCYTDLVILKHEGISRFNVTKTKTLWHLVKQNKPRGLFFVFPVSRIQSTTSLRTAFNYSAAITLSTLIPAPSARWDVGRGRRLRLLIKMALLNCIWLVGDG